MVVTLPTDTVASEVELFRTLGVLAHDSMEGRRPGTAGARRAARFLSEELRSGGVPPAFPDGYVQGFPLVEVRKPSGRVGLVFPEEAEDFGPGVGAPCGPDVADQESGSPVLFGKGVGAPASDAERSSVSVLGGQESGSPAVDARIGHLPPVVEAWNLVGRIPGADPRLSGEAVIVSAHYDHLGIQKGIGEDSVYNGADDNASGVVVALEVARAMAASPPPRTVVILLTSAEEFGTRGARWYAARPAHPLEQTVAVVNLDTVGRPDPKMGGQGWAWLTGYRRTTVEEKIRAAGIPIGPDPRPWRSYDTRSDHAVFAAAGVPAHTLSTYGDHDDFHRPSDESPDIDIRHLRTVTQAAVALVREIGSSEALAWRKGRGP